MINQYNLCSTNIINEHFAIWKLILRIEFPSSVIHKDIIIEQLQVEESDVNMDTNLMKDLSADSLDAVEIIMAIEDTFGIEIPDDEAEKIATVKDAVDYIESHS